MTLDELIQRLEDLRDVLGTGDSEVLVATQPSYPISLEITDTVLAKEIPPNDEDDYRTWIVTKQHNAQPYAPKALWEL